MVSHHDPHFFFSMDRPNYSRLLVYLADMNQLSETHHTVNEELNQPFAQVRTDIAVEQSSNLDSKTSDGIVALEQSSNLDSKTSDGIVAVEQSSNLDSKTSDGIVAISQRPGVLDRWFVTCHERAAITTAMKIGIAQMTTFVEQRLNTKEVKFWDIHIYVTPSV